MPVFLLIFVACILTCSSINQNRTTHIIAPQSSAHTIQGQPRFAHIFLILEENKQFNAIAGNAAAPYINGLMQRYATATNYSAVAHPSLPNYLALTSGTTNGVTNDCSPPRAGCEINVQNIADKLESAGLSWKEYADSMPSACYANNSGRYVTKHNPFVYYTDILDNTKRCTDHVIPFSQLDSDLSSTKSTPNFAFISPDLCNDMHDCPVATGDVWLAQQVPRILQSPAFTTERSLLVITWDEGETFSNTIVTIFAGTHVKNGYQSSKRYDHYSLLHTIEANWSLTPLAINDSQAPTMGEFFN